MISIQLFVAALISIQTTQAKCGPCLLRHAQQAHAFTDTSYDSVMETSAREASSEWNVRVAWDAGLPNPRMSFSFPELMINGALVATDAGSAQRPLSLVVNCNDKAEIRVLVPNHAELMIDCIELYLDGKRVNEPCRGPAAVTVQGILMGQRTFTLNCLSPGKHFLQARYRSQQTWSRVSKPVYIAVPEPTRPKIIALGEGNQTHVPPITTALSKVQSSELKLKLADFGDNQNFAVFIDDEQVAVKLVKVNRDQCCVLIQGLPSIIVPGVHHIAVRGIAGCGICAMSSERSNRVSFHYDHRESLVHRPGHWQQRSNVKGSRDFFKRRENLVHALRVLGAPSPRSLDAMAGNVKTMQSKQGQPTPSNKPSSKSSKPGNNVVASPVTNSVESSPPPQKTNAIIPDQNPTKQQTNPQRAPGTSPQDQPNSSDNPFGGSNDNPFKRNRPATRVFSIGTPKQTAYRVHAFSSPFRSASYLLPATTLDDPDDPERKEIDSLINQINQTAKHFHEFPQKSQTILKDLQTLKENAQSNLDAATSNAKSMEAILNAIKQQEETIRGRNMDMFYRDLVTKRTAIADAFAKAAAAVTEIRNHQSVIDAAARNIDQLRQQTDALQPQVSQAQLLGNQRKAKAETLVDLALKATAEGQQTNASHLRHAALKEIELLSKTSNEINRLFSFAQNHFSDIGSQQASAKASTDYIRLQRNHTDTLLTKATQTRDTLTPIGVRALIEQQKQFQDVVIKGQRLIDDATATQSTIKSYIDNVASKFDKVNKELSKATLAYQTRKSKATFAHDVHTLNRNDLTRFKHAFEKVKSHYNDIKNKHAQAENRMGDLQQLANAYDGQINEMEGILNRIRNMATKAMKDASEGKTSSANQDLQSANTQLHSLKEIKAKIDTAQSNATAKYQQFHSIQKVAGQQAKKFEKSIGQFDTQLNAVLHHPVARMQVDPAILQARLMQQAKQRIESERRQLAQDRQLDQLHLDKTNIHLDAAVQREKKLTQIARALALESRAQALADSAAVIDIDLPKPTWEDAKKRTFTMASAAHFPIREYDPQGLSYQREGAVIYEDMTFQFDQNGEYRVNFKISIPNLPTDLRLQFLVQAYQDGPWYTLTMPLKRIHPNKRGNESVDGRDRQLHDGSFTGTSETLKRFFGTIVDIKRKGSARFGHGQSGLGGLNGFGVHSLK